MCNRRIKFFLIIVLYIAGRNVQVPCLGLKSCTAFSELQVITEYVITECFACAELHKIDTVLILKLFAQNLLILEVMMKRKD